MKYAPKVYAQALAEVLSEPLESAKEKVVIKNFIDLVLKNGDSSKLKKIVELAGEIVLQKSGRRRITIETARPLTKPPAKLLSAIGGSAPGGKKSSINSDIVESKIEPSLIAGLRLTINKDLEWDGSLVKKLQKLFT